MIEGMIGRKVGMTQIFLDDGSVAPVTVIEAGPCVVVQCRTAQKEGYDAVQLGLVDAKTAKRANKAMRGHHEKAGVPPTRLRREFKGRRRGHLQTGRPGSRGHLRGRQEGRRHRHVEGEGLQGVMKRHNFRRRRQQPRLDVPSRAGLDRLVRLPLPSLQGHARHRSHGDRPRRPSRTCA
jgi:large subunit ribosomal protein L3